MLKLKPTVLFSDEAYRYVAAQGTELGDPHPGEQSPRTRMRSGWRQIHGDGVLVIGSAVLNNLYRQFDVIDVDDAVQHVYAAGTAVPFPFVGCFGWQWACSEVGKACEGISRIDGSFDPAWVHEADRECLAMLLVYWLRYAPAVALTQDLHAKMASDYLKANVSHSRQMLKAMGLPLEKDVLGFSDRFGLWEVGGDDS